VVLVGTLAARSVTRLVTSDSAMLGISDGTKARRVIAPDPPDLGPARTRLALDEGREALAEPSEVHA
jgi:hypothetical protein